MTCNKNNEQQKAKMIRCWYGIYLDLRTKACCFLDSPMQYEFGIPVVVVWSGICCLMSGYNDGWRLLHMEK